MRSSILLSLLLALLAGTACAQPNMDGFEGTPYLRANAFHIFFDTSVTWDYGGIIADPVLAFYQTLPTHDAWLVLVAPTAETVSGFRIGRSLAGTNFAVVEEVLGAPLSVQIVDDVVTVVYDEPVPGDGTSIALIRWSLVNPDFTPVEFYLWPAPGDEWPVYFEGNGDLHNGRTFNGSYYQYTAPVAILNGGVTPDAPVSWSKVKALYR